MHTSVQIRYPPLKIINNNGKIGSGKLNKIEKRKKEIGTRHRRKLKRYSNNFNKMFDFFLEVNRKGIITFCGSKVTVYFDVNGLSSKECFRLYEDGFYKNGKKIVTKHPNILKLVLIGKKGWGLWVEQWSEGIVDWTFTKEEIFKTFENKEVKIPEPFVKDFINTIERKKIKRNLQYYNEIKHKYEK